MQEAATLLLEGSESDVKSMIQNWKAQAEFPAAYFDAVRTAFGSDPVRAEFLAGLWDQIANEPLKSGYALRTKSILERMQGDWLQSAQSAIAAGKTQVDPRDRLLFQVSAVDALGRAGEFTQANKLAERLFGGLVQQGDPVGATRVAINAANAYLWGDRPKQALNWFVRAQEALEGCDAPFEMASCLLGRSTCELIAGNALAAIPLAERAEKLFVNLGQGAYVALCRINHAQANCYAGNPDWAAEELRQLKALSSLSAGELARVEEFLGDAYLRLNLLDEAWDAYGTASRLKAGDNHDIQAANLALGQGDIEAARKRWDAALERYGLAETLYRELNNQAWVHQVRLRRARVAAEQEEWETAAGIAEQVREDLGRLGIKRGAAEAALVTAHAQVSAGTFPESKLRLVHRAVTATFASDLNWQLNYLKARVRTGLKSKHAFQLMVKQILAQRLLIRSTIARSSFFHDKAAALGAYLELLLESGTRQDLAEAVQLLDTIQSATLVDELMSTTRFGAEKARKRLNELRQKYSALNSGPTPGGPERVIGLDRRDYGTLQRDWLESSQELYELATLPHSGSQNHEVIRWIETPHSLWAVGPFGSQKLPLSPRELQEILRWVHFELSAPQLGFTQRSPELDALLHDLARGLAIPGELGADPVFMLSGQFWQVPWPCLADSWGSGTPRLCLTGQRLDDPKPEKMPERVALWYQSHPELPHIGEEAESFLRFFPHAMVCSSLKEIHASLESAELDLLHVACHANHVDHNPMFSSLTFADGSLPAVDIAHSGLRVKEVVLSACRTSVFSRSFGVEPNGLARAFLGRGASRVVASQWALNDAAAALGMQAFYASRLAGGDGPACITAFQRAVQSKFDHPYYWAPLVLLEGYS